MKKLAELLRRKMVKKFQKLSKIIKKHHKKTITNIRWEVRYNNLKKKYDEKEEEIKQLKKQLDEDENLSKIRNLQKYNKMLFRQRNELRKMVRR